MRFKAIAMASLAAAALMAAGCGEKKEQKMLVLYYSQTGNTKAVATEIATRLGAETEEIVSLNPYDGDFRQTIDRCLQEREQGILPEVKPLEKDLKDYDVIFLGYPVWFGTFAPPVTALLDKVSLAGKKVVPFCTFGSGGLDSSVKDLEAKQKDAQILPGYGVRAARMDAVPREVERFLIQSGFLEGDYTAPAPFPEQHPVSEEESAILDQAVAGYPMMNPSAVSCASREVADGTEYLFTAEDKPRDGAPAPAPAFGPRQIHITVLVEPGKTPVFTQVVR